MGREEPLSQRLEVIDPTAAPPVWAALRMEAERAAKADAAAQKAYEGDGQTSDGERRESAALARQFPDYAALMAGDEFEEWCDALYRPLFDAPWRSLNSEASR